MIHPLPLLLLLSAVAGLLRHSGLGGLLRSSGLMVNFAAPMLLALLIVLLWRSAPWHRQMLLNPGCLLLAEIVRLILFGFYIGWQRWSHIMFHDSKRLFLLLAPLAVQILVGLLAFGVAKLLIRTHGKELA